MEGVPGADPRTTVDGGDPVTTATSAWYNDPPQPPTVARAVPGTLVGGRYQLRTAIGTGGMGTVWQAADTLLTRDVAVKEVVFPPGMAAVERTAMYERTLREARAAAALSHPSVVQVYDVVTEGDRPWIVMELLHARSLAELIIADGPLAPRAVAKIGIALLGALEVAHEAGVLHRDVKPANVLICTDGRCVLTDFGVARLAAESNLTTPGMVLGSPHFISPERAIGAEFGPPSDLFSLGVSLYTAVEGRPPFDRGDPFETMRAVVEDPPATPVRAGNLGPVLLGLLDKDPGRRWDVTLARRTLRALLDGPLANRAIHHVTDPHAVVPPAPAPPLPPVDLPTGRVGGRAMITDAGGAPVVPAARRGPVDETDHGGPDRTYGRGTANRGTAERGEPRPAWTGPQDAWSDPPDWSRAGEPPPAPARPRGIAEPGTRRTGPPVRVSRRLRDLSRPVQVTLAAGAVVLLALAGFAVAAVTSGDGGAVTGHPPATATTAAPRLAGAVGYADPHGFSLNVPGSWKKAPSKSSYVDFTDPQDGARRLRVNVEPSGTDPVAFLASGETRLQNNVSGTCAGGYQRKALRSDPTVTLDGRQAAELEYTCGTGDQARHGIWRVTIVSRHAYEFYLTTPEPAFAQNLAVYQEAVRSYKITSAAPGG